MKTLLIIITSVLMAGCAAHGQPLDPNLKDAANIGDYIVEILKAIP